MVTYQHVKLAAEVVAFLSLSAAVYVALTLRSALRELLSKRELDLITAGILVFWAGYFVNVLNDIIVTDFMKVADDVLVAIGMFILAVAAGGVGRRIKLRIEPKMVLGNSSGLPVGSYIALNISARSVLNLLAGKKVVAVTRYPERWKRFGVPAIWLTNVEHPDGVSPTRLAPLLHYIIKSAEENTFVILDSLDYLILHNGEESSLKFLLSLKDYLLSRGAGLILIVDPATVDGPVLQLLLREFEPLKKP